MSKKSVENMCIGLIVPPYEGGVPEEVTCLYGERARFISVGIGLEEMSASGYDAVIDRVSDCAKYLVNNGAGIISLMGTSISFYKGQEFNDLLRKTIEKVSGHPATTMTDSIVNALKLVTGKKIAVATAYSDDVNSYLKEYLEKEGYFVTSIKGLNIKGVDDVCKVRDSDLEEVSMAAFEEGEKPDALFISCGGLRTLRVTSKLESKLGIPVISSAIAGAWGVMRVAGKDASAAQAGGLFERKNLN